MKSHWERATVNECERIEIRSHGEVCMCVCLFVLLSTVPEGSLETSNSSTGWGNLLRTDKP